ncbi:hypothetical protein C9I86_18900 [Photobacterium sp. NCIMB 13483]|uniref:DUF4435 domain-containing protein n=1 Tax=Photobacterium sp. NCIMB 13483 TaxID=2022103 RepID=UPI000D150E33|nr:DUF4435 domain-containing protein [Photobacterium sp. NCIMB 13483]PST85475.1 hypothetical protein C9I86_18900 [Photobacterium sp. NCIMB 13483]
MDRSEMMRQKRRSNAVDLIKLIKRIDCFKTSLICIFEGEDSKYYGSRIDPYFSNLNRKNLSCKGKEAVLKLREKVASNQELNSANILFFVDIDFDEKKQTDYNIYSTPCYSIENLYVTTQVFSRILTDELGLCSFRDKELIDNLINIYEKFESDSDDALAELNAWLIVRIKESESNENINLNLNNISVDKFLSISGLESTKKYNVIDLDSIFKVKETIDEDALETAIHIVNQKNKANFCRGKYRLEYFRLFLIEVFNESRNGEGNFVGRKVKPKLTLVKTNIISELSQYAETPECLNEFLSNFKSRIVA